MLTQSVLISSLLILLAEGPHNFTIIDYWERICNEGDEKACAKLEANINSAEKLDNLTRLSKDFDNTLVREDFMLDKRKPNLGKAYPIVISSYLDSLETENTLASDQYAIDYCAKHFHNYWLNKKLWWPTNDEDKPDWRTIYVYIVDHYHGICLKQPF